MLSEKLRNNQEALHISVCFYNKAKYDGDDVTAAINVAGEIYGDSELENVVHQAYVMCTYMHPDAEDVIAMLLFKAVSEKKLKKSGFAEVFPSNRGVSYFEYTDINPLTVRGIAPPIDIPKNEDGEPQYTREECIELHIMHRVCQKMYGNLQKKMQRFSNRYFVFDAYKMAESAHYWVKRATGEPYVTHPLMVAEILVEFGVESTVVAAAILHDTVEDTEITLEAIEEKCGKYVATYVDAVTSLHSEYERITAPENRTKDKLTLDKESFEKLVEMVESGRHMVFALYIKAADRIHNLRTMDNMSPEKIRKKMDETDVYYLPLFKRFGLHYFSRIIEDLIWRLDNPKLYYAIKNQYDELVERNNTQIESTVKLLKNLLDDNFNVRCSYWAKIPGFDFSFDKHYYSPLEISNLVKKKYGDSADVSDFLKKHFIPLCDVDIILDPKDNRCEINSFSTVFIKECSQHLYEKGRVIVDFEIDEFDRFIVAIEDESSNLINCCFTMRDDYLNYLNGDNDVFAENGNNKLYEDDNTPNKITVKLRNGDKRRIKKDATVLDLAFMIHEEIGLTATGATINNVPATIFSTLHDEDTVVVFADTCKEDGETPVFIPHAEFEWFNNITTTRARNCLVKYFTKMYKGDAEESS